MYQCNQRRSMLFIPGNKPKMHQKAGLHRADSVVFDLEDSVNPDEKEQARLLVKNALTNLNFPDTEVIVRINAINTGFGVSDIYGIASARPCALMIPKASEDSIKTSEGILTEIENSEGISVGSIKLFLLIETAYGVENVYNIIKASSRVIGVLFGAEDFTADMGIFRTEAGEELFYARSRIAICSRACRVDAIDTPYLNLQNDEGLAADIRKAKQIGMTGKAAIHPSQIEKIHRGFAPSEEEIRYASRVLEAKERVNKAGGVLQLDGRMIDAPVIERAEKVISRANLSEN